MTVFTLVVPTTHLFLLPFSVFCFSSSPLPSSHPLLYPSLLLYPTSSLLPSFTLSSPLSLPLLYLTPLTPPLSTSSSPSFIPSTLLLYLFPFSPLFPPLPSFIPSPLHLPLSDFLSPHLPHFPSLLLYPTKLFLQSTIVGCVPGVGYFLSLLHMAMLYSLYSFEYKWINEGKPLMILS